MYMEPEVKLTWGSKVAILILLLVARMLCTDAESVAEIKNIANHISVEG